MRIPSPKPVEPAREPSRTTESKPTRNRKANPTTRPHTRTKWFRRILLRPSGTEPVVRVMVEAPTDEQAREIAEQLAALVKKRLAI